MDNEGIETVTALQTKTLKGIADRLSRQRNDPQALADFSAFLQTLSKRDREDLATVLMDMIAAAKGGVQ